LDRRRIRMKRRTKGWVKEWTKGWLMGRRMTGRKNGWTELGRMEGIQKAGRKEIMMS
jgi:hypothetical protein